MKGTYQKNRSLVMMLAALAWFGVLLQLFVTLHSNVLSGKGLVAGIVRLFRLFHHRANILVTSPDAAADRTVNGGGPILRSLGCHRALQPALCSWVLLITSCCETPGIHRACNCSLGYPITTSCPPSFLLYWWFNFPKGALRWTYPLIWGLYPTVYLGYVCDPRRLIDNYPYGHRPQCHRLSTHHDDMPSACCCVQSSSGCL